VSRLGRGYPNPAIVRSVATLARKGANLKGSWQQTSSLQASYTIPWSSGFTNGVTPSAGDLLLIWVFQICDGTFLTAPSGFTSAGLVPMMDAFGSTNGANAVLFWKAATGAETNTTVSGAQSGYNLGQTIGAMIISGADTTNPFQLATGNVYVSQTTGFTGSYPATYTTVTFSPSVVEGLAINMFMASTDNGGGNNATFTNATSGLTVYNRASGASASGNGCIGGVVSVEHISGISATSTRSVTVSCPTGGALGYYAIQTIYVNPAPATNYADSVLASSPILYWRMNTTSGTTVTDYSGNSRNGTTVNSPTLGTTGLLSNDSDTAMTFATASSQRVDLAYASWMATSLITLEAIVKPNAVSGVYSILDRDNSTSNPNRVFQFRINAGKFEVILWDSTGALWTTTSVSTLVVGQKYHLAATHDGTTTRLYINGVLDQSATRTGTMQLGGTQGFSVGSNASIYQFFNGVIDEVAWYSTALSSTRIAAHAAYLTSALSRNISDSAASSDSITRSVGQPRLISDSVASSDSITRSVVRAPLALYPTLVGGMTAGANETTDWTYSPASSVYTAVPFQVGKAYTPSADYDPARYVNIGVLAFDASTLPDGLIVTSATISLFTQDSNLPTTYLRIGSWGPTLETSDWQTPEQMAALPLAATFTGITAYSQTTANATAAMVAALNARATIYCYMSFAEFETRGLTDSTVTTRFESPQNRPNQQQYWPTINSATVPGFSRSVTDSVSLSDALIQSSSKSRALADSTTTSDAISRNRTSARSIADALTTADSISRSVGRPKSISDSITFSETTTAASPGTGTTTLPVVKGTFSWTGYGSAGVTISSSSSWVGSAPAAGDTVLFIGAQSHDITGDSSTSNVGPNPYYAIIDHYIQSTSNLFSSAGTSYVTGVSYIGDIALSIYPVQWTSGASYNFVASDDVQFALQAVVISGGDYGSIVPVGSASSINPISHAGYDNDLNSVSWIRGTATSVPINSVSVPKDGCLLIGIAAMTSGSFTSYGSLTAGPADASINYQYSDGTRLRTGYKIVNTGSTGTTAFTTSGGQNALSVALLIAPTVGAVVAGRVRSPSDSLTISDAVTGSVGKSNLALSRNITDVFSASDSGSAVTTKARAASDTLASSDVLTSPRVQNRDVSDSLTTSDSLSRSQTLSRPATDATASLDSENRASVYIPPVNGNSLSVPNSSALDITGDIDIRVYASIETSTRTYIGLAAKQNASARGWILSTGNTNNALYAVFGSGATTYVEQQSSSHNVPSGTPYWFRVTRIAASGVITFYKSPDGATWTTISTHTLAAFPLITNTRTAYFGATDGSANALGGRVYRAVVIGDGSTVLDIDCSVVTSTAATTFTAATGQTVTINKSAAGTRQSTVALPITAVSALSRAVSDSITASDALGTPNIGRPRSATDSLTASDALTQQNTRVRSATDVLASSDVLTSPRSQSRAVAESLTSSESVARKSSFSRTATDLQTASDSISRSRGVTSFAADIFTTSDVITVTMTRARTASDSLTSSDTVARSRGFLRAAIDAVTASDSATCTRSMIRLVNDSATSSDSASAKSAKTRGLTDALTLSDIGGRLGSRPRNPADSLTVSEALVVSARYLRTGADVTQLADVVAGVYRRPFVGWGIPV